MAVQLALTPDRRWPGSSADLVMAAAAVGFAAVGVPGDRVDDDVVGAYENTGVRCHEVLALVLSDDEPASLAAAEELAAQAQAVDADWVLTVFTAPISTALLATVERCASIFTEAGAGMAVEFSPLGPVATIADGLELVGAGNRGTGRAGLLIDTWHFAHSASTGDDLAQVPLDELAYIQFTDAREPGPESLVAQTLHRRALPGEGVLELDRFAATLLDRGFAGIVSAEVLSADLRSRPLDEIVRRVHDTMAPYWS